MIVRSPFVAAILFAGIGSAWAQYYPVQPIYPPAPIGTYPAPPGRALPPMATEDDDEVGSVLPPPGAYDPPPPGAYPPGYDPRGGVSGDSRDPRLGVPQYPDRQYPDRQDAGLPPPVYRGDPRDPYGRQDVGRQDYSPQPYPSQPYPPQSAPPGAPEQEQALRPPIQLGPEQYSSLPPDVRPETGPVKELPPQFRRTVVDFRTKEPAGTLIVDTPHTYLYLVLGNGKAMRYGIGVGREGFTWTGTERVSRMAEWPDWHPPDEMIERQPYLPRFMAGGEGNPLGARALYLGKTLYRIHGTNQPSTIGTFVSSGCIRLTNEDITDLYTRVQVGTRVVVLPGSPPATASAAPTASATPINPLAPPPGAAPAPTAGIPGQAPTMQAQPMAPMPPAPIGVR